MQQPQRRTVTTRIRRMAGLVAVALAFLAVPGLDAQEPEESGEEGRQELMAELQQVNQELVGIRQRAMQDPELQQEQAATEEKVIAAMTEVDPEAQQKLDRIQQLQGELQTAQQEGDQEKMGSLLQERRQLEQSLQQAQAQAMEQQEVAAAVESFRQSLVAAMKEVDPKAEQLLQRQEELQAELMDPGAG